jgi:cytochrome c oxidase assembly protein subunit 15
MTAEPRPLRPVALWLLAICALVAAMVVLGGVTRLTHSGLSMVTWEPIVGAIPPLSEAEWQEAFDAYKRYPEYRLQNPDMTLGGFQRIYLFEYAHRLLGRLVGVVFLVPFVVFLLQRRLPAALVPKLVALFALGGLQGLLGWYMVKSGLVERPDVSQYRLAAHLAAAFLIFGYGLWLALGLLDGGERGRAAREPAPPRLRRLAWLVVALVSLQVIGGAFVAGTDAGLLFNTFPTMNGAWLPDNLWSMQPAWLNLFENRATIQFQHRVLAAVLTAAVLAAWWIGLRAGLGARARVRLHLLLAALVVQVALGIVTLLHRVPVSLGALHQSGALLLFATALLLCHALRRDLRAT